MTEKRCISKAKSERADFECADPAREYPVIGLDRGREEE